MKYAGNMKYKKLLPHIRPYDSDAQPSYSLIQLLNDWLDDNPKYKGLKKENHHDKRLRHPDIFLSDAY
jgi:hypothetical protein